MLSLPSHGLSHEGMGEMVEDGVWQTHVHSARQFSDVAASFADTDVEAGDTISPVSPIESCVRVKNENVRAK